LLNIKRWQEQNPEAVLAIRARIKHRYDVLHPMTQRVCIVCHTEFESRKHSIKCCSAACRKMRANMTRRASGYWHAPAYNEKRRMRRLKIAAEREALRQLRASGVDISNLLKGALENDTA
jgi:post-segregation antitoxin (ccd killing protein)